MGKLNGSERRVLQTVEEMNMLKSWSHSLRDILLQPSSVLIGVGIAVVALILFIGFARPKTPK